MGRTYLTVDQNDALLRLSRNLGNDVLPRYASKIIGRNGIVRLRFSKFGAKSRTSNTEVGTVEFWHEYLVFLDTCTCAKSAMIKIRLRKKLRAFGIILTGVKEASQPISAAKPVSDKANITQTTTKFANLSDVKKEILIGASDHWCLVNDFGWPDNQKLGVHLQQMLKLGLFDRKCEVSGAQRISYRLTDLGLEYQRRLRGE